MVREFANCSGEQGLIPGRVIPKTKKWYLTPNFTIYIYIYIYAHTHTYTHTHTHTHIYIYIYIYKFTDRGRAESSLFNSYYTEV